MKRSLSRHLKIVLVYFSWMSLDLWEFFLVKCGNERKSNLIEGFLNRVTFVCRLFGLFKHQCEERLEPVRRLFRWAQQFPHFAMIRTNAFAFIAFHNKSLKTMSPLQSLHMKKRPLLIASFLREHKQLNLSFDDNPFLRSFECLHHKSYHSNGGDALLERTETRSFSCS